MRREDTDLELEKIEAAVEAVLFAMGDAVSVDKLALSLIHISEPTRP